ncbi:hypothetical protein XU18_2638 [Perkinsela sp. CCAP 1560/4]|nr:hypothetical protein XU18_2638 [Perkinsela sp. CCAP 1560/4]|eukprot:KNH06503.1 hypothetical protein XU18_2638 [Perkinsela sp. CCAP 1560/4]
MNYISYNLFPVFSLCALVVVSADVSNITPGDKNLLLLQWQTTLMDRFYTPKNEVERADYLRNLHDYCEWKNVKCVEGYVVEVDDRDCHYKLMDIHVLPPTLEYIRFTSCSLRYKLHTRALPRALNNCNVSENWLFGTVGLRTLPEHLVNLDLSINRLVGPVDLTELPRTLRILSLWDNRIRQSVILFGQLPPNLMYVEFHVFGRTNRIGELRGTSTENVERLGNIFRGIPLKNIHIK